MRKLVGQSTSRGALLAVALGLPIGLGVGCLEPRSSPTDNTIPTQQTPGGTDGPIGADGPPPVPTGTTPTDGPTVPGSVPPDQAGGCPQGFHQCKGTCVSNLSPETCGSGCESCPTIKDGTTTCDGTKCGVSCPSDKKPCLDACVPMNAPCDSSCPPGKNLCSGICVDATSLMACGPSCAICPASDNGTATCKEDTCELTCNEGFYKCEQTCNPLEQPCKDACPQDRLLCNGKCVPGGPNACCADADCGACKKCTANRCEPSPNGAAGPMCAGPCRACQGGACMVKPTSTVCMPRTCDNDRAVEGRCGSDGECALTMVQNCDTGRACGSGNTVVEGRCTGNGQCTREQVDNCSSSRSCNGSVFEEGRCTGSGQCTTVTVDGCRGFGCSGNRCKECRNASDCGDARCNRCDDGQCQPVNGDCGNECRQCQGGSCRPVSDGKICQSETLAQCIGGTCRDCGDANQACCASGEACFNVYRCNSSKKCCDPNPCENQGIECGEAEDGCGRTVSCTNCPPPP